MENNNLVGVKEVICMAQEIADRRNKLMCEMKAHLQAEQNEAALAKARELCGICELASTTQEAA